MKNVEIRIEYRAQNEYRLTVIVDGQIKSKHAATRATVVKTRNKLNGYWSRMGSNVTAEAIPEAFDMR